MSKKPKAETQENVVLKTGTAKMILRWALICLALGVVIGALWVVVRDLGLFDNRFASEPSEIVATLASNEAAPQSDIDSTSATKIDLAALGIKFEFKPVTYNGKAHKLVATYADGSEVTNNNLAKHGLSVAYYNNVHTNAGTYTAFAVFADHNDSDGIEYEPLSVEAEMVINRATFDTKKVTFPAKLAKYTGEVISVEVQGLDSYRANGEEIFIEYSMNSASEIGVYNAVAVVHSQNYNPITLKTTLTIVDLEKLVKFDQDSYTFTYDGKEHSVELNTDEVLDIIKEKHKFQVRYNANTFTNAGNYTVTATVSAEGYGKFDVSVPVVVEQGDLVAVHGTSVVGSESEYDGKDHKVTVENLPGSVEYSVEYYKDGEKIENVPVTPGTYTAKVTFVDTKGNLKEVTLECQIIIHKVNISQLVTFNGAEYTYEVYGEEEIPYERKLEAICDLKTLAGMGINVDELVITYSYYDKDSEETLESSDPFVFTDAGKYVIKVHVTGDDTYTYLYADVELEATLIINYAHLEGVEVNKTQMVYANGAPLLPTYVKRNGAKIEYFHKGEATEGFKYFGIYKVDMQFTKGNYRTTETVTFIVMFNPKIIPLIALICILPGIGLGIFFSIRGKKRDDESDVKFARPGEKLEGARGKILCQSYAKYGQKPGVEGRLYLTEKTVEFYGRDFSRTEDRILIPLRDVRNVDATIVDTIKIRANDTDYIFQVPGCKSVDWKRQIVYAKAVPVVRKPEAVPVVMVDKLPELLPQPQPQIQPAADTLTTVDFQVKVKTEPGAEPKVTSEVVDTESTFTGGTSTTVDASKE